MSIALYILITMENIMTSATKVAVKRVVTKRRHYTGAFV